MNRRLTAIFAVFFGVALSGPSVAGEHELGEELYTRYCASCHGDAGTGGGPVTEFLRLEIRNLTTIKARNDGVFPLLDIIHIIDGRTGVRGHGGAMPVWGAAFMQEEGVERLGFYGSVLETRGRILSLALYLETIQE